MYVKVINMWVRTNIVFEKKMNFNTLLPFNPKGAFH